MDSVVPTPEELKRQLKILSRIQVDERPGTDIPAPTPRQQKKIERALGRIIKESTSDSSAEKNWG